MLGAGGLSSNIKLVRFGETQPLKLVWIETDAHTHLVVRNDAVIPTLVSFTAVAQDRGGNPIVVSIDPSIPTSIAPFETKVLAVKFSFKDDQSKAYGFPDRLPGKGLLRIRSLPTAKSESDCAATLGRCGAFDTEFTIPAVKTVRPPGTVLLGSLSLALAIALIVVGRLRSAGIALSHRMGSPTWSFDQSWGANVALASALLSALLTFTVFPESPHLMARESYLISQTLLAALLAFAPAIYGLFRQDIAILRDASVVVEHQGFVGTFVLSSTVVVWAALGQVITLALLVSELSLTILDPLTTRILEGVASVLLVAIVVYSYRAMYQTARDLSLPSIPTAAAAPIGGIVPPPPPQPLRRQTMQPPLPQWAVI